MQIKLSPDDIETIISEADSAAGGCGGGWVCPPAIARIWVRIF